MSTNRVIWKQDCAHGACMGNSKCLCIKFCAFAKKSNLLSMFFCLALLLRQETNVWPTWQLKNMWQPNMQKLRTCSTIVTSCCLRARGGNDCYRQKKSNWLHDLKHVMTMKKLKMTKVKITWMLNQNWWTFFQHQQVNAASATMQCFSFALGLLPQTKSKCWQNNKWYSKIKTNYCNIYVSDLQSHSGGKVTAWRDDARQFCRRFWPATPHLGPVWRLQRQYDAVPCLENWR